VHIDYFSEVLRPSVHILADEEAAKGNLFLPSFEDRAWREDLDVDLDSLHNTSQFTLRIVGIGVARTYTRICKICCWFTFMAHSK
jgi:hypothetical protein